MDRLSEFNTSNLDNLHKKIKLYQNDTGPGDYEVSNLTGHHTQDGSKINAPKFSFASKSKQAPFISKDYMQVIHSFIRQIKFL